MDYSPNDVPIRNTCGYLPPFILKKYDTINHLNNTCTRLQAELDKQMPLLRDQRQKQKNADLEGFRAKLQQLAQLQFEKFELAVAALAEVKQVRNQLMLRMYQEEHKSDSNVLDTVFNNKDSKSLDNYVAWHVNDLLLNVRAHAASGLLGNSLVLPVHQRDYYGFAQKIYIESDDVSQKDFPSLTLCCQPEYKSKQLKQVQKCFLQCLQGKRFADPNLMGNKPNVQQDDIVVSAFAEVPGLVRDAMNGQTLTKLRPVDQAQPVDKYALMKELQDQLRLAARKAEILIQKAELDKHSKSSYSSAAPQTQQYQFKIGEIIQNGCMPLFNQCEDSLDTSLSSSQISFVQSNILNTQQVGDDNSVLIEDSEPEGAAPSPPQPQPAPQVKKVQKTPVPVPVAPVRQPVVQTQPLSQFQLNQQQQLRQFRLNQQLTQTYVENKNSMNYNLQQLLNPTQQNVSEFTKNYCIYKRCTNTDESTMIMCERGPNCKYAKEGWFHATCLGFQQDEVDKQGVFDDCEFYCPGCWVDIGRHIGDWGCDFKIAKKRMATIRKKVCEIWLQQYSIALGSKNSQAAK